MTKFIIITLIGIISLCFLLNILGGVSFFDKILISILWAIVCAYVIEETT